MHDLKKNAWENSYQNKDNFIYYPKEETVKFLNRFIKKKLSLTEYVQNIESKSKLKALDFGCGIGRMTVLLHEFDIDGYGIDISETAVNEAKNVGDYFNFKLDDYVQTYDGERIPFDDNYFDFTISEGVLDSLSFVLAKKLIKEISRVTKKYFYVSLIAYESSSAFEDIKNKELSNKEIEVGEEHEKGTIQSFFDSDKIDELIKDTDFNVKWCELHTDVNCITNQKLGRYYIVFEK